MSYRDETVWLRQKLETLESDELEARRSTDQANALADTAEREAKRMQDAVLNGNFALGVRSVFVGIAVVASVFALTYLFDREAPEVEVDSWTDETGTEHAEPCSAKVDDAFLGLSTLRVVCGSRVVFDGPVDANPGGGEYWHHGQPSVVWSARNRRIIIRSSLQTTVLSMGEFRYD